MRLSIGDLIVLDYGDRIYSVFVKRIDRERDEIVCCEQMTPQYIQEVFIPISSLNKSNIKVLSKLDLTNLNKNDIIYV